MSRTFLRTHSQRLPTEVCEKVISFIDEDNRFDQVPYRDRASDKALRICTLVCRSWVARSRIHLFRSVAIESDRARKFMTTVTTFPTLGVYVERLYFSGGHLGTTMPAANKLSKSTGWIYKFFKDVIPLLPNLTFMEYKYLPVLHPRIYACPPELPSLTSLSLHSVAFESLGDFLRLIGCYKHLQALYIRECSWGSSSSHHYYFGQRWSCDLQHLVIKQSEIRDCFDFFHWLTRRHASSFEHLTLKVLAPFSSKEIMQTSLPSVPHHLAMRWATHLKMLSLQFSVDMGSQSDEEDLAIKSMVVSNLFPFVKSCYNLHTIKLRLRFDTHWLLQRLPDIFSSLSSLCRLAIDFRAKFDQVFPEEYLGLWGAMDRVLADSNLLTKLEYVEIRWQIPFGAQKPKWEGDGTSAHENGIGDGDGGKGRESDCVDRESDGLESKVEEQRRWVAYYHRKTPLTRIFPLLSSRGILWCCPITFSPAQVALQIFTDDEILSRKWRPLYRLSLLDVSWYSD